MKQALYSTRRIEPTGRQSAAPHFRQGGAVLVTGGGGFLGSHIVMKLLARGEKVRVFGRRPRPELAGLGVDCRQGDLADEEAVRKACEGCHSVIHTAALPGIWGSYTRYYRANYLGTKHVIDAAIAAGAGRLVYTSTPSVVHGGRDIEGGDETLPYARRFLTHYAATKAMAERLVLNMNGAKFATLAIRPHLIYGPGDTQLIPKLLERARRGRLRRIGKGENRVSVSYVENVADAHLLALDSLCPGGKTAGQAYFVNEPEPVNCWDFINRLAEGMGLPRVVKAVPYPLAYVAGWLAEGVWGVLGRREDPPMTRFLAAQLATSHWFSTAKAERELGWRPAVEFEAGVERTLAWLRGRQ